MKVTFSIGLLLAILPVFTAQICVAQNSPERTVSLAQFKKVETLPADFSDAYMPLFSDANAAGGPQPEIYIADADIDSSRGKQEFVMLKSPLTCSAQGACQIDLWNVKDGKGVQLLTTVAFNIGTIRNNGVQTNGTSALPTIVTNVENITSTSRVPTTPSAQTNTVQALKNEWTWNGASYE